MALSAIIASWRNHVDHLSLHCCCYAASYPATSVERNTAGIYVSLQWGDVPKQATVTIGSPDRAAGQRLRCGAFPLSRSVRLVQPLHMVGIRARWIHRLDASGQ